MSNEDTARVLVELSKVQEERDNWSAEHMRVTKAWTSAAKERDSLREMIGTYRRDAEAAEATVSRLQADLERAREALRLSGARREQLAILAKMANRAGDKECFCDCHQLPEDGVGIDGGLDRCCGPQCEQVAEDKRRAALQSPGEGEPMRTLRTMSCPNHPERLCVALEQKNGLCCFGCAIDNGHESKPAAPPRPVAPDEYSAGILAKVPRPAADLVEAVGLLEFVRPRLANGTVQRIQVETFLARLKAERQG